MDFITTFFKNYGFVCLIGLFIAVLLFLWFVKYRKKHVPGQAAVTAFASVIIIFILWLFLNGINSKYIGYGYCTGKFKVLACGDNVLWGMDEFTTGKGNDLKIYRIQGLDLDSGWKLFRKLIDHHFEYIGYKKHLMWAYTEESGNNVIGMDPVSGKVRVITDKYNLMKRAPDLSKVIYKYSSGSHAPMAAIAPKGSQDTAGERNRAHLDAEIFPEKMNDQKTYELNASKFSAGNGSVITFSKGEKQKLSDDKGNALNNELDFYSGKFLLFDELAEKLVVLSYATPENKEFILRYLSSDGKLVWEARQSDLKVGDLFNSEPNFEKVFIYKDKLIFSFEGFVFSLDSFNGQLNWLTRM
jgi:hypothetical protein